jgi:hypothetical protein
MKPQYQNSKECTAALTEIWRRVLGKPDLGADADLFENGGASLHVLQIVAEVYDSLGAHVKMRNVFRHASPMHLADFLVSESAGGPATEPVSHP